MLIKELYYQVIPILPEKDFLSKIKIQKEFHKKRAKFLKRFLTGMLKEKQCFNLKLVKYFFFDEIQFNILYDVQFGIDSNFNKLYNNSFFKGAFQKFKKFGIFGNSEKIVVENKDSKFLEIHQEIEHLKSFVLIHSENIKNLKDGFGCLKKSYQDIVKQYENNVDSNHSMDIFKESVFSEFHLNEIIEEDKNIQELDSGRLY